MSTNDKSTFEHDKTRQVKQATTRRRQVAQLLLGVADRTAP